MKLTEKTLARMIDHTYVKPDATTQMILKLCKDARKYDFYAVYALPTYVPLLVEELAGTETRVGTGVGFPLGAHLTEIKVMEAEKVVDMGAEEIDVVINIGALKSSDYTFVKNDIKEVVRAVRLEAMIKVILETYYLTEEEIVKACQISKDCGINFVKSCTGFTPVGAKVEHIRLMREAMGSEAKVKAAGGINDLQTCINMIKAGANRIGTSKGDILVNELREKYDGSYEIEGM